jgi:NifU-like protein involved in Fe-S cluster formation
MSAAKEQQSFVLPIIRSLLLLLQQKIQQVPQHPEQIKCYLLAPSALKSERERERERERELPSSTKPKTHT